MDRQTLALLGAALALPALICAYLGAGIIRSLMTPDPDPQVYCFAGYSSDMSLEEVAILLGLPTVEMTWLPEDLAAEAQISIDAPENIDNYLEPCTMQIAYGDAVLIRVTGYVQENDDNPQIDDWTCSADAETQTRCWSVIYAGDSGYWISVNTSYPVNITARIARGIVPYEN